MHIARAQGSDPAASRPGRDPKQPIDEEYTKKISEYTTEPFFLSPLVDYMPAKAGVPTPKAVLGDIAGAPGKLPYSKEVYDYMRQLAKAMPGRVKVYSIGTTEEGREHIAVAIASEALMSKLDANKANLAKLADPRTIGMNDMVAAEIAEHRGAGLLHHRHDPLDGSRRADGADGARVSSRGRRRAVRQEHPRSRDHADHADRRSRRTRSCRRRLQVEAGASGRRRRRTRSTGATTSRTTTIATRWA